MTIATQVLMDVAKLHRPMMFEDVFDMTSGRARVKRDCGECKVPWPCRTYALVSVVVEDIADAPAPGPARKPGRWRR